MKATEKIEMIKKYRDEKEYYLKHRPKIVEKFRSVFEGICKEIEDLDIQLDPEQLSVQAVHHKYKGYRVHPAVLNIDEKSRLCLVYIDADGNKREVVDITKANLRDVLAVTEVLGDFRKLLEEEVIEAILRKEEGESEKIKEFVKDCKIAYEGFSDLLDGLKALREG